MIGSMQDVSAEVSAATRIPVGFLDHSKSIDKASIAMKMSWISKRETSRDEDMAYSLLGLFDVNMPLVYGEGRKAFLRLQLEIIKKSDDESIFAWTSDSKSSGMLATWPSAFADSWDIMASSTTLKERLPYAMTNKGLEFYLPPIFRGGVFVGSATAGKDRVDGFSVEVPLNCWYQTRTKGQGGKSSSTHIDEWRGPVLSIELAVRGHAWRRIYCNKLGITRKPRYTKAIGQFSTNTTLPDGTSRVFVMQEGM